MKPTDWWDAVTLGETVYKMVLEKKTESQEFKDLLKHFGQEKLKKLYLEEREKRKKEIGNGGV